MPIETRTSRRIPRSSTGACTDSAIRRAVASTEAIVTAGADEDDELVTPETGGEVAVADGRAQPARHLLQQLVAGLMSQGVVDLLELVEVHEQHGHPLTRRAPLERGPRVLLERGPVGQLRQRVVHRLVLTPTRLVAKPVDQPPLLQRRGRVVGQRREQPGVLLVQRADVGEAA